MIYEEIRYQSVTSRRWTDKIYALKILIVQWKTKVSRKIVSNIIRHKVINYYRIQYLPEWFTKISDINLLRIGGELIKYML